MTNTTQAENNAVDTRKVQIAVYFDPDAEEYTWERLWGVDVPHSTLYEDQVNIENVSTRYYFTVSQKQLEQGIGDRLAALGRGLEMFISFALNNMDKATGKVSASDAA